MGEDRRSIPAVAVLVDGKVDHVMVYDVPEPEERRLATLKLVPTELGSVTVYAPQLVAYRPAPPCAPPGPPWLEVARGELGVREVPGVAAEPRIVAYHASTTLGATVDEVPWCSSFVNWCLDRAGIRGTRSAAARSWLTWGTAVGTGIVGGRPRPGAIVVLERGANPQQGHVGFLIGEGSMMVQILGGNQGDAVSIASFPRSRILGYRWPPGWPLPA